MAEQRFDLVRVLNLVEQGDASARNLVTGRVADLRAQAVEYEHVAGEMQRRAEKAEAQLTAQAEQLREKDEALEAIGDATMMRGQAIFKRIRRLARKGLDASTPEAGPPRDIPREAAAFDAVTTDDSENEPPDFDVADGVDADVDCNMFTPDKTLPPQRENNEK